LVRDLVGNPRLVQLKEFETVTEVLTDQTIDVNLRDILIRLLGDGDLGLEHF
jgi:hypothetical protein